MTRGFFASRWVVPVLAGGLLVVALLSPLSSDGRYGDSRVSTNVTGPLGARGLFETVARLGWRAERQITPGFAAVDSTSIFAILAPPIALSERETGLLLDRVRKGGSLLVVIENGTPLSDSLGLATAGSMTVAPVADTSASPCPANEARSALRFLRGRVYVTPFSRASRLPPGNTVFLNAENPASQHSRIPVAAGFALGRGRVAAVSDANIFRNDVIRVCRWNAGLAVVRMIEYLSGGSRSPRVLVVFDEFHQGFGQQPNVNRAILGTLTGTPPGRAIAQVALAAIVLLAAIGPRPVPPQPRRAIERRSPFEHVDALASAYSQAHATQLATSRLVRGLQRRIAGDASLRYASTAQETVFLETIARTHSELSPHVATLERALTQSVSDDDLAAAGRAIEHIERTLTK